MAFTSTFLFFLSLLIYIALWAYWEYRLFRRFRKQKSPNAFEVKDAYEKFSFFRQYGPFAIVPFLLLLMFILPEVKIVTYDKEGYYRHANLNYECYYVPFYYKGRVCVPWKRYMCNDTDSALVLYPVYYTLGSFMRPTDPDEMIPVKPHYFGPEKVSVYRDFITPTERTYIYSSMNSSNLPNGKYWYLDTKSEAEYAIRKIDEAIRKKKDGLSLFWSGSYKYGVD